MKVVTSSLPIIKFIPRFYPSGEIQISFDIPFVWEIQKNLLVIALENTNDFIEGTDYEFTVSQDENIIYKGRIFFVADNNDKDEDAQHVLHFLKLPFGAKPLEARGEAASFE